MSPKDLEAEELAELVASYQRNAARLAKADRIAEPAVWEAMGMLDKEDNDNP